MAKKELDWEVIEKEFRAGQLSIREIASQHGCSDGAIRKRMKALGVERDLTEQVAQKVRTDLVRAEVRTANPLSEKEIVDTAAARVVEVVRGHRTKISTGVKVVSTLFDQLTDCANNREDIIDEIESETAEDESQNRKNMMLKAVGLQANASTAVSLSLALKNLIGLEREAFNIKSDSDLEDKELIAVITRRILK